MPTPSSDRLPWKFEQMQPEMREAKALEYIAYYLDRIEQHLAVIAQRGGEGHLENAITAGCGAIAQAFRQKT